MRNLMMIGLLAAGSAHAATPQDYAWQWPIQTEGEAAAYVIELDADVLANVTRSDLRDLAVFNASGEAVAFAPWPYERKEEERREPLAWLRVPLPAPGQPESLALRLERDADGRLRGLDLRTTDNTPPPAERHDLLVDRGEDEPPALSRLHVQLADNAALPVNLRVRVSASDDLTNWQSLGTGLPLVALDDNGLRIERLQLDIARTEARYLRLAIENDGNWPAIAALQAERRITGGDLREWKTLELTGTAVADQPGSYTYTSPAPVAVERADLRLAASNSVSAVQLNARARGSEWWQGVSNFTAFRLGSGDDEVRHVPPSIGVHRHLEWQLNTQPALTQPPTLLLSYRPERFVLLAQGEGPYVLVAGSGRAAREDYPVKAALAASSTPPKPATLGARTEAGGQAALGPKRGEDWQRWLLWAVLAAGAGLVLVVSLRVLRHPKTE
ncbi:DUF3999 family protein [Arenimonas alkanexedens]